MIHDYSLGIYYCAKYEQKDSDKEFIKKTKRIGEPCKIDADCDDEIANNYRLFPGDSLECIDGKCSDKWYFEIFYIIQLFYNLNNIFL